MNERRKNKGMRKSVYAWFALCELFSPGRRTSTFIIIFCLFLIAITISIFGFYGESAREAQEKIIMEGYPTRITAKCPPDFLHDKSKRFNEDTMQEIRELPGVTNVFEKINMGATLKAPGGGNVVAYLENTIPDDPGLAEQRMLWGKGVSSEDCDEIIVSETLLHRIWPEFRNNKIPGRIQLSVERGSGVNRLFTKDFRLVGIVKGGEVDDAYLPTGFMKNLELWCKSAIEKLPEPGEGVPMPEIRYDSARVFAYTDVKQEELEDEAKGKNLNITLKRASEPFKETYFEGIPFLVVSRKGASVSEGDVNRIRSALSRLGLENNAVNAFSPFSDEIISEGARFPAKIKAVNLDDVRLKRSVPGSIISAREALETKGRVIVSENFAKRLPGSENAEIYRAGIGLNPVLRVAGVAGNWKDLGGFDIICSMETMRHFTSDITTQPRCMVWSSDPMVINMLDKLLGDKVSMSQGAIIHFSKDSGYHYGMDKPYHYFELEIKSGMYMTIRFIPDDVLQSLSVPGRDGQADDMPALVVMDSQADSNELLVDSNDFSDWAIRNNIYIAGVFSGKNGDEVWLPVSAMKEGIFFGRTVRRGYFKIESSQTRSYNSWRIESFKSYFCTAILDMPKNEARKYMDKHLNGAEPFTLELVELETLPDKTIKFSNSSRERIFTPVICNDPSISRLPFRWARNYGSMESNEILINHHDCPYYPDKSRFTLGSHKILLKRVKSDSLPPGLMVVNRHFVASNPAFFFGPSRKKLPVMAEIMLPDVTNYQKVLGCLGGFSVKPLFTLKNRMIVCYNVTDAISSDGKMDEKLLPILRSERMFINVCPNIATKASLVPAQQGRGTSASKDFTLMSSYANDMTMFMNGGLKAGGWLSDTSEYQAVLPEEALKELDIEPRFIAGKPVTLLFKKDKQLLFEPSLNIETRIAGVVSGDRGYIPVDLANRIALWKEGLLDYDTDRGFIHPHEIYKSQGRIACNVYVKNIDKVRPVVAHLREMGYETEDSLAEQEGLIRLGRSLISFVVIVVLGTLLLGTVNILVIMYMNTRSGMFRMGILRSSGVSRPGILCVYVMMVIVIVGLAGISAIFFLGIAEPIIRNTLLNSGISLVKYASGSILDFRYWWIHMVSLLIYSTSAFIGVMFSACKVCNLRVCELFQTRDL